MALFASIRKLLGRHRIRNIFPESLPPRVLRLKSQEGGEILLEVGNHFFSVVVRRATD